MSAINFLIQGGLTSEAGDMSYVEQLIYNELIEKVAKRVKVLCGELFIPTDQLPIFRLNFLFIAKDQSNFHFAFVDMAGMDEIKVRDFTSFESPLPLNVLIDQLKIEYGEVHWAFTVPINVAMKISDTEIEKYAKQYIDMIIEKINQ